MQLLKPSRSTGMHDGWETARNINRPKVFQLNSDGMLNFNGKEHCVIQLGRPCQILRIIIDTNHYKGNFPESCYLEVFFSLTI
jgi:allantoicase